MQQQGRTKRCLTRKQHLDFKTTKRIRSSRFSTWPTLPG